MLSKGLRRPKNWKFKAYVGQNFKKWEKWRKFDELTFLKNLAYVGFGSPKNLKKWPT